MPLTQDKIKDRNFLVGTVGRLTTQLKEIQQEISRSSDIGQQLTQVITTTAQKQNSLTELASSVKAVETAVKAIKFPEVPKFPEIPKPTPVSFKEVTNQLQRVERAIREITFPEITIPPQQEIVFPKIPAFPESVSLKESEQIISKLGDVKDAIKKLPKPDQLDITPITNSLKELQKTISGLTLEAPAFPTAIEVSNFPPQHVPTPVTKLAIRGTGTDTEATVSEFTSSNALATYLVDANGNQYNNLNPVPITGSLTPSGTQDVNLTKVGGASFSLGQQLAASSLPVVLTAAQLSTLTPLSTVAVTQSTSPWVISGSVTADAGANLNTSLLALASTQTDKSQFTKLTDGTDTALVTTSGELNVLATAQPGIDIGDVTINNSAGAAAVNIQDGGNTITVDGTVAVTQSTSPWVVTTTTGLTTIGTGRTTVTTAGTRVVLAASTACKKVDIVAETDNTGLIVVGGTSVVASLATRQGVPLYPGDTYTVEIDNLNDINLDSTVSTDGVTYTYYT